MAQAETPAARTARLRQEALAQFYANRVASAHQKPTYTVGDGSQGGVPAGQPAQSADNRGWLQRLLDALGGNPSGR